jgi:hypothetical protein
MRFDLSQKFVVCPTNLIIIIGPTVWGGEQWVRCASTDFWLKVGEVS